MEKTLSPFLTFPQKIFIVIAVMTGTFLYSAYQKSIYEGLVNKAPSLILKELPEFQAIDIDTKEVISKETFKSGNNGLLVHFWGTWCAPCEAELPSFMEFVKKLESFNIKVLILAVNDEELAVKKFIRRFQSDRPKNVLFGLDKDGLSLPIFGSAKVPETYLFSSQLRHLEKFEGPQDWNHNSYKDRVLRFLEAEVPNKTKQVESH